jgi:hypothetical protein
MNQDKGGLQLKVVQIQGQGIIARKKAELCCGHQECIRFDVEAILTG